MVSIAAQLLVRMHLDIYMLYMNHFCSVHTRCTLDCKKLM